MLKNCLFGTYPPPATNAILGLHATYLLPQGKRGQNQATSAAFLFASPKSGRSAVHFASFIRVIVSPEDFLSVHSLCNDGFQKKGLSTVTDLFAAKAS